MQHTHTNTPHPLSLPFLYWIPPVYKEKGKYYEGGKAESGSTVYSDTGGFHIYHYLISSAEKLG